MAHKAMKGRQLSMKSVTSGEAPEDEEKIEKEREQQNGADPVLGAADSS